MNKWVETKGGPVAHFCRFPVSGFWKVTNSGYRFLPVFKNYKINKKEGRVQAFCSFNDFGVRAQHGTKLGFSYLISYLV